MHKHTQNDNEEIESTLNSFLKYIFRESIQNMLIVFVIYKNISELDI